MTFTIDNILTREPQQCINGVYDLLDISKQTNIDIRQIEFYDTFYNKKQQNKPTFKQQATEGLGNKIWRLVKRRIMHGANNHRDYFSSRLESLIKSHEGGRIRLLEIGPFQGTLTTKIALKHLVKIDYVGVDLANEPLQILRKKCVRAGGDHFILIRDNILDCPLRMGQFDLIVGSGVLHHFDSENKLKLAKLMYNLLKPGGKVLYFEPINTNPLVSIARYLSKVVRPNLDWEHPFTKYDIDSFNNVFDFQKIVYFDGAKSLIFPLLFIPYSERVLSKLLDYIDQRMNEIPQTHFIFLRVCIESHKNGLT